MRLGNPYVPKLLTPHNQAFVKVLIWFYSVIHFCMCQIPTRPSLSTARDQVNPPYIYIYSWKCFGVPGELHRIGTKGFPPAEKVVNIELEIDMISKLQKHSGKASVWKTMKRAAFANIGMNIREPNFISVLLFSGLDLQMAGENVARCSFMPNHDLRGVHVWNANSMLELNLVSKNGIVDWTCLESGRISTICIQRSTIGDSKVSYCLPYAKKFDTNVHYISFINVY